MKALVIGATGATGKDLVQVLLNDDAWTEVIIFVRRPTGWQHPKLHEVQTDFQQPERLAKEIRGDVFFSLLGTTLKQAGSKANQEHIDLELPAAFATIAKQNGVSCAVLLSAYGASARSRIFYSRLKGRLEDHFIKLNFETTIIFRPGLLLRKNTDRSGERISAAILRGLNSIGLFKRFKPMPTAVLAQRLASAPFRYGPGVHFCSLHEIFHNA